MPDTRESIFAIVRLWVNPFGVIALSAYALSFDPIRVLDTYAKKRFCFCFLVREMGMVKGIASPYPDPTPKKNQIFWSISVFGVRSMESKVVV